MNLIAAVVLLGGVAGAQVAPVEAGDKRTSLLILTLDATGGVTQSDAEVATLALAAEVRQYEGFRVSTLKDIEASMTNEMRKQLIGCDTTGCAAEVAGALNSDQIVIGRLAKTGDQLVISVTRIRARDSVELGSAHDMVILSDTSVLLQRMPYLVEQLMAGSSKTVVGGKTGVVVRDPRAVTPATAEQSSSRIRWPMRIGGGAVAALAVLAGLAGVVSAAVVGAVLLKDNALADAGKNARGITANEALVGNVALWGAAALLPVTVLAALAGAGMLGGSLVVP